MIRLPFISMAAAAVLFTSAAKADNYPSRPIKAVIPFGAGSATDIIPRIVFEQMSSQMGQTIVVENRGGAGGTIGANAVAKSDPDGYTIMATSSAHTLSPGLYSVLPYDASADFAGVGLIGSNANVMIISPSKGFKTIQEFVAAAKAKPNSVNFATVGVGSAVHISAERFRISAGYEATHIPFKGGAEALSEVVAGRVDYYFCPVATALPFIREGKLTPLVTSSPTRSALLPDVPTTLEAGFANSDYSVWIGIFAPAKTPRPIVEKLHEEMKKAIAAPAVQERLRKLGVEPLPLSPSEMDKRVKDGIEAFKVFAKEAGLKAN
jgi:tripartite-type tricarboxylate transporter receptor subunit TctC